MRGLIFCSLESPQKLLQSLIAIFIYTENSDLKSATLVRSFFLVYTCQLVNVVIQFELKEQFFVACQNGLQVLIQYITEELILFCEVGSSYNNKHPSLALVSGIESYTSYTV